MVMWQNSSYNHNSGLSTQETQEIRWTASQPCLWHSKGKKDLLEPLQSFLKMKRILSNRYLSVTICLGLIIFSTIGNINA